MFTYQKNFYCRMFEVGKLNIHYYCTTSLEASAIGIENFTFNPKYNQKYLHRIPYIFSHKAAKLSDVKKLIDKILKKKTKIKKIKISKNIYIILIQNILT